MTPAMKSASVAQLAAGRANQFQQGAPVEVVDQAGPADPDDAPPPFVKKAVAQQVVHVPGMGPPVQQSSPKGHRHQNGYGVEFVEWSRLGCRLAIQLGWCFHEFFSPDVEK